MIWPSHFSLSQLNEFLNEGNVKGASQYVNAALQISPQSPSLHLVNGFLYEEMMKNGDDSRRELISIAYRTARNLDPSQWLSHYLLGKNEARARNYEEAQQNLANALLLRPQDPDILYALAYASYYLWDIPVALFSIRKAVSLCANNPAIVRAAAIITAAAGDFSQASQYFRNYEKLVGQKEVDVQIVQHRIEDWRGVYARARLQKVSDYAEGDTRKYDSGKEIEDLRQEANKIREKNNQKNGNTIIIDCYVLRTSATHSTSKGQNLFDQLAIQLSTSSSALVKRTLSRNTQTGLSPQPVKGSWTKNFSYAISPVTLNYSLNIMNASSNLIEVIGRPSVSALVGESAFFVQGMQYIGASTGGLTGASTSTVDAGTKMEVIPRELTPDGTVVIELSLMGSLFTDTPNTSKGASQQIFILSKSNVTTVVKAKLGQTVMLGGLYSRTHTYSKGGFPLLQDIPFLQYFFANSTTEDDTRCVVYLLTPRRGGSSADCPPPRSCRKSKVSNQLRKRGFFALGEYNSLYYIIKNLDNSYLFSNFRSGDIPAPFWGYETVDLRKKINQLSSFLWF